jgi:hypothetical protein
VREPPQQPLVLTRLQTLDTLHTTFPRALRSYLPDVLDAALVHLEAYLPAYVQYYVVADEPAPKTSEDEALELPNVAAPLVDFVAAVARAGRAKEWFVPARVGALVAAVFAWAQISTESEESWAASADAFINEEGDASESYSIRTAGFDLLAVWWSRGVVRVP